MYEKVTAVPTIFAVAVVVTIPTGVLLDVPFPLAISSAVMLYLKNVTTLSVLILIGLILYPYFSTPIFLWILEKIQMVWNFIFAAVHNRVSVYS